MFLGGDIGGTKTNLAYFEKSNNQLLCKIEERYSSHEFASLDEIVLNFIQKHQIKIDKACFGIAGPIRHETVKTTNLPWKVDAHKLSYILSGAPVHLINDLEANAWGIELLKGNELELIQNPTNPTPGHRALISAGTGLGEAGLYFDGKNFHPFASEAGHADFAPRNSKEAALLSYLGKKNGHVSYERVLSGQGLYNIYQFLNDYTKKTPPPEIKELLNKDDPAKVISQFAEKDALCQEALEMMVSFYGAEAGNMALRYMALGGVYIGGGIAPKIIHLLKTPLFLEAFCNKGRFQPLLKSVPISVILNDKTALLGAGQCASRLQ